MNTKVTSKGATALAAVLKLKLLVTLAALLACAGGAQAANATFDGGTDTTGGSGTSWSTAANWTGDTLPTFNNALDIYFQDTWPYAAGSFTVYNAAADNNRVINSVNTTAGYANNLNIYATLTDGTTRRDINWEGTGMGIDHQGAGVLTIGNGSTTGAWALKTSVSGTLTFTVNVANSSGTVVFNSPFRVITTGSTVRNLTKNGDGLLRINFNSANGADPLNGAIAVNGGVLQVGNGGTAGSLGQPSSIAMTSPGVLRFKQSDNQTQSTTGIDSGFNGKIMSGNGGFEQAGSGTVILDLANTYTGPTTVSAGTLQLGSGGASGSLDVSSAISVATNATFAVNRTNVVTQGTDFSSAAITGAGGFTQAGSGTTVLNAANAYTGPTAVNGGTLVINGNQSGATGAVTVNTNATLRGTGTIGGGVTIKTNGVAAPGDVSSAGTLTLNNQPLTLESGAKLNYRLGTTSDTVAGVSALTLNGQQWSDFTFTEEAGFSAGTYVLVAATAVSGSLGATTNGYLGAYSCTLSVDGNNDLILTVSASSKPTVTINQAAGQNDPTNTAPIYFTVQFSADVTGFTAADVTLGGTANPTTKTVTTNSASNYTVAVGGMTGDGTVTASIGEDVVVGGNIPSTSTDNQVTYETTAPTLAAAGINVVAAYNLAIPNVALTYTITFSEDINDSTVDAADFDNAGSSAITIGNITETAPTSGTFNVSVTPTTAGTLMLRLKAGATIKDIAGNAITALPVTDADTVRVIAPVTQTNYVATTGSDANAGTSWADAYLTITNAVGSAKAGIALGAPDAVIYVGTGTFVSGAEVLLDQPIAMIGGTQNPGQASIVAGQGSTGSYRVFRLTHASARLEGLTIQNGWAATQTTGGGVNMTDGTMTNCVIRNNRAQYSISSSPGDGGGGVWLSGGTVAGCVITNNRTANTSPVAVRYCAGGGVSIANNGILRNCIIQGNFAGESGDGERARGGGVFLNGAGAVVENCLIRGNVTTTASTNVATWNGGGVYLISGTLRNCTIVENQCSNINGTGGGVYQTGGALNNCIIANNTIAGASGTNYSATGGTADYSCAPELTGGTGNLTVDPQFASAGGGNFRLMAGVSPCINAGLDDLSWMSTATDLDGQARLNGTVDMGACESAAYAWDGGHGSSGSWQQSANWDGDPSLTFDNTREVAFYMTGAARLANVLGANTTIRSLVFDDRADANVSIDLQQGDNATGSVLTFEANAFDAQLQVGSGATGNISVGGATALGSIVLADNLVIAHSGSGTLTLGRPVTEAGGPKTVTKTGTGTLILSAANTYTGLTTVSGGVLTLGHASDTLDGDITVSGGTLNVDNPDTLGAVTLNSGTISGDSTLTGSSYAVASGTVSAALGGSAALAKTTAGAVILSGANTYTGSTTISAGTLQLGAGSTAGSLHTSSVISVASNAVFTVNQTDTVTQGTDFSGAAISGEGGLTQAGSGTLVLNAANSYTGPTTLSNGTVRVNGSLAAGSTVTVNNGASLAGTGMIGGNVTIRTGGVAAPGGVSTAGALTLNNSTLTLQSGAKLNYRLGTASDTVAGVGTLALGGQVWSDFTFTANAGFGAGTYVLVAATNVTGALGGTANGTIAGYAAALSVDGNNDLILTVSSSSSAGSLTNTAVAGGSISFSAGGSGTLIVQASTNLADPGAWVNLATNAAPFSFTDTNAVNTYPQRFYRTKTP